jgi:predicted  nucleic acid-binding Zn-ribbon protein
MALWECPKCGAIKDVVCPVCGVDKEAGRMCTACGSEYSHTSCPKCGYSDWHEASLESNSYEEKIRDILRGRENKYLTYYELMRLVANFEPISLQKVCVNDPIEIKNVTQAAFNSNEDAVKILCGLQGVNEGLAQRLLNVLREPTDEDSDQH